ncbi:MAG TPA: hypothetical protein VK181_02665 [Rhizobium sp.]|nr:hypothetical protein [Rhizobium sp.]
MPMRMRCLAITLLSIGWAGASGATQPAACLTKSDDGGLQDTGGSVVADKKEFYDGSKVFPVRTFSDQAATGKTAEFCLRYEIENPGPEHIRNLYWGLAGILVKDFRPGAPDRQSRSKQILSTKDPEVQPTTINAFVNEAATPKVWVVESQHAQAEGAQFNDVVAVDRDQLIPADVRQLLAASSLPQRHAVLALSVSQDKPIHPVRETVSGQGFSLEVVSRVVADGNSVSFQTNVSLSGDSAKEARISMPALQALEGAKAAGALEYYAAYLDAVAKRGTAEPITDFTSDTFSTTVDRRALLQGTVFLSEHVITVQANDNEYCYRFQSYTPFAVDFDLDQCRR